MIGDGNCKSEESLELITHVAFETLNKQFMESSWGAGEHQKSELENLVLLGVKLSTAQSEYIRYLMYGYYKLSGGDKKKSGARARRLSPRRQMTLIFLMYIVYIYNVYKNGKQNIVLH